MEATSGTLKLAMAAMLAERKGNGKKRSSDVLHQHIAETALAALRGDQSSVFTETKLINLFRVMKVRLRPRCYMR